MEQEKFPEMNITSNANDVFQNEECKVMRLMNETGEGTMTIYQVFEGVYIMYNNFHMKECKTDFNAADDFLCIDHCREGQIETCDREGNNCSLTAGELRVDDGTHNNGTSTFPLNHYYGITIGFELNKANKALKGYVPDFSVSAEDILRKYCRQFKPYVIASAPEINHIFSELYNVPASIKHEFYKIKILELLLYLSALEIDKYKVEKPYFYKGDIEKIRAIHKLMTTNLNRIYTIEELAQKFDIKVTALKKCFRNEYGTPVFTYMKKYRLNTAAVLLKHNKELKISEIAERVGYTSASKFSAAFAREMGRTPLEYRRYGALKEVLNDTDTSLHA